jgi:chromosome segregation ATPase
VYESYHAVLDKIYKELHVSAARKRVENFRNNLKNVAERGNDALDNERARLMRQYERLKGDITTYENNLGFLNVSSKKGNSLIDEMKRRIQRLKDELEETRQKIKTIDSQNKE